MELIDFVAGKVAPRAMARYLWKPQVIAVWFISLPSLKAEKTHRDYTALLRRGFAQMGLESFQHQRGLHFFPAEPFPIAL
jgi:hypothetical protein